MSGARCCAEVGRPGAWTQCPRRATATAWKTTAAGRVVMAYCARHADRLGPYCEDCGVHGSHRCPYEAADRAVADRKDGEL